jgi:hypothetical protein
VAQRFTAAISTAFSMVASAAAGRSVRTNDFFRNLFQPCRKCRKIIAALQLLKGSDSYQGIALAIPQVRLIYCPFRGWLSNLDFFSNLRNLRPALPQTSGTQH